MCAAAHTATAVSAQKARIVLATWTRVLGDNNVVCVRHLGDDALCELLKLKTGPPARHERPRTDSIPMSGKPCEWPIEAFPDKSAAVPNKKLHRLSKRS